MQLLYLVGKRRLLIFFQAFNDIGGPDQIEANNNEEEKTVKQKDEEYANYNIISANNNNKRMRRPNSMLAEISESVYILILYIAVE